MWDSCNSGVASKMLGGVRMGKRTGPAGALALIVASYTFPALAQSSPQPDSPAPAKIEFLPPGSAQAAPPQAAPTRAPNAPSPEEPAAEGSGRKTISTLGIGPTYVGAFGGSGRLDRLGVVLDVTTQAPIGESAGFGVRFAWGLTEFRRFEDFTRAGYRTGRWTTNAYKDVWDWAAQKDDYALFRWMGAFFAFVGLVVPYVAAGLCYLASPVAPTTYLELDATFNYGFGGDKSGPYLKGGLGFVGYLHPRSDELRGGLGPTIGLGARFGSADVGVNATWLPTSLHGEIATEHTNIVIVGGKIAVAF